MAHAAYDPRYLEGIRRFNAGAFFEAHEVWEDLWRGDASPSRRYYQGLIQVAVCLHHFGRGNTRGARKLYHSSRGYLTEFRSRHGGVDVDRLLADLEQCCAELVQNADELPRVSLFSELIPQIHFEPLLDPSP